MAMIQTIPKMLIYETVDHKSIYYKHYRDYLDGNKQLDEIVGNCSLGKAYKSNTRLYSEFKEDIK